MARGGLALALLMTSLDTSIVNASLPLLGQTLGISFQSAQWIVLAYLLAVTSFTVSAGRVGDVVGRRRLLLAAIALFIAASVVCAAAPSLRWLISARAAQGICAGAIMALAVAMVADLTHNRNGGRAMGQLAAMSAIGTTLGPVIAGALSRSGRGAIFLVNCTARDCRVLHLAQVSAHRRTAAQPAGVVRHHRNAASRSDALRLCTIHDARRERVERRERGIALTRGVRRRRLCRRRIRGGVAADADRHVQRSCSQRRPCHERRGRYGDDGHLDRRTLLPVRALGLGAGRPERFSRPGPLPRR